MAEAATDGRGHAWPRLTTTAWALVIAAIYRVVTLAVTLHYEGAHTVARTNNSGTSPFSWWDGLWYLRIAQHGYDPHFVQHSALGLQQSIAFPPALAALMAGTHAVLGVGYGLAGLVWCAIAFGLLAVGLTKLIELDYSRRVALITLLLLLLWPPAIFLGMLYQDGITLAGVVWAFVFVRKQRPVLAGLCLSVALLGKLVAAAAIIALVVEHLHLKGEHNRRRLVPLIAIPGATLVGWIGYGAIRYHHATAAIDAEREWGHHFTTPWQSIRSSVAFTEHVKTFGYHLVLGFDFVAIALVLLAIGYLIARHVRPAYVVYTVTVLLALTTNGVITSLARYCLLAFPMFLAAALLIDRLATKYQPVAVAGVAVLSVPAEVWLIGRFARYYWAG